jgi:hypothetical protein
VIVVDVARYRALGPPARAAFDGFLKLHGINLKTDAVRTVRISDALIEVDAFQRDADEKYFIDPSTGDVAVETRRYRLEHRLPGPVRRAL